MQCIPWFDFIAAGDSATERHASYVELVGRVLDSREPAADFHARMRTFQLDDLLVFQSHVGAQVVGRSAERPIRDGGQGPFMFELQLSPGSRGQASARTWNLRRGDMLVCDFGGVFEHRTPDLKVVTVGVPREVLKARFGALDDLHGLVIPARRAAIVGAHLRNLARNLPQTSIESGPALARATVAILVDAVRQELDRDILAPHRNEANGSSFPDAIGRARAFIEANLADRDLSPDRIGAALGLSRASLYRLFKPFGGVTQYVWRRRLARVRRALLDPREVRPAMVVASQWGFVDDAHFRRAFQAAFGVTPTGLRAGRQSKPAPQPGEVRTLQAWYQPKT